MLALYVKRLSMSIGNKQAFNIATERINIRIHRDITGEMWFGVG
jgi:hypothetical protein